jgi:hypothetical protein
LRKMLLALFGAATLASFGANQALAAPFCYNKNTGAFAHWGKCRAVCNYYGPGGTCRKVVW